LVSILAERSSDWAKVAIHILECGIPRGEDAAGVTRFADTDSQQSRHQSSQRIDFVLVESGDQPAEPGDEPAESCDILRESLAGFDYQPALGLSFARFIG